MAGPAKKRAQAEKKPTSSSDSARQSTQGSSGREVASQRSVPKSIPRLDGNRDPTNTVKAVDYSKPTDLKNISEFLGILGWYQARGLQAPDALPHRPKVLNNLGKELMVKLNTFNVLSTPTKIVHQYDVAWGAETDATKRAVIKKIWQSKAVKSAIGEPQNMWIYDGNKLAWCAKRFERDEIRVVVDLDEEENQRRAQEGLQPRRARASGNKHKIFIKWTREVPFTSLQAFLDGHISWDNNCIDMVNFLDHVMRETPSQHYTQIKKSFFQRGEQRFDLGGGIEAFKGVFSSLRPVLNDKLQKNLAVNVDVANGTFWRAQELPRAILQVFNCQMAGFQQMFVNSKRDWRASTLKKDLARFKRVGVTDTHNPKAPTQWTIDEFVGLDAEDAKFPDPDHEGQNISVRQYFKTKYNFNCTPKLPVVRMTKKIRKGPVYLPMECLKIDPNQRYNAKLSDRQTAQMITFAVTRPRERWAAVQAGVGLLNWQNDPYLQHYGIKINPQPATVKARQLPLPTVSFAGTSTLKPTDLTAGRWRIDKLRFIGPNEKAITSWGVCVIGGRGGLQQPQVQAFVDNFIKIYKGHGGKFSPHPQKGEKPYIMQGNLAKGGEMIAELWNATGNHFQSRPMFLMFMVNDRNIDVYRKIKKSCDCRFGVVSQVLQSKNVEKNQPQYISNVCMKVNAKLGGATSFAKSTTIPKIAPKSASLPTMIIGADVSHPAPGSMSQEAASFAAITCSADATFTRYWAECNTNGNRVEMVTTDNIDKHLGSMARKWIQRTGRGQPPKRVLYIRDGVSEGQYAAVIEEEVRDMKQVFAKAGCKDVPKFTVVIAGKRHHIRFFPDKGGFDQNGNPVPGTLVETGCTHPFEFDWYLCAHVAIKGTARPIHYQCILNEGEYQAMELQQLIFEHSFQYCRSTTPVSLHPAVYYAHLAADRSRAHVNDNPVSSGKKEAKGDGGVAKSSTGSSKGKVEIDPLIPMSNGAGAMDAMWFV
ncbi:Piwi domain-containing protein [Lophiotrema nucula]|uniref:Piwi domain-containing protein n=1 Tax=Lophiotrema nucula TaxID=690887 RepID=A0A6A5ZQL6_9PLEO|nr:Piwi domain-containing protein [Lophiotrema nucula]